MTTKRLPFQASTLCAGGTLLVLGGFLALNLAGCGGGGGGIVGPTPNPNVTPTPVSATLQFQLQRADRFNATGGSVTLTSQSGLVYNATANNRGVVSLRNVAPGLYTLVFRVLQNDGKTTIPTTRTITVTSPTTSGPQFFTLIQGDTGNSNPFTITGRVLLNPVGETDPDGNSNTANCSADINPITDALIITVRDLNATNGTAIIAQTTRPAQDASVPGPQRGRYSISIPYAPRSFQVTVTNANDAPFAGLSASTSFPQSGPTTLTNVDVCTNNSSVAPQPAVTPAPTATPFLTPTPVGTPLATATSTSIPLPTIAPTVAPTAAPTVAPTVAPTTSPF